MVKKRLPTNPIYTFLKLFYEYLSNSKLTIIQQGTKYQLISLWSCDHSIGCICSFHYNPQFFRQFALAAVKMLLPHANAHAWHSSEGNREKRPRSAANCQHIRNREKKKRKDFSDDLQAGATMKRRQSQSVRIFYLLRGQVGMVFFVCAVAEIKYHVVCDFVTLSAVLRLAFFQRQSRKSPQTG